jgi:hypothetical protein
MTLRQDKGTWLGAANAFVLASNDDIIDGGVVTGGPRFVGVLVAISNNGFPIYSAPANNFAGIQTYAGVGGLPAPVAANPTAVITTGNYATPGRYILTAQALVKGQWNGGLTNPGVMMNFALNGTILGNPNYGTIFAVPQSNWPFWAMGHNTAVIDLTFGDTVSLMIGTYLGNRTNWGTLDLYPLLNGSGSPPGNAGTFMTIQRVGPTF